MNTHLWLPEEGKDKPSAVGSQNRWAPEQPRGSGHVCLFFQVKINSRGLVYSVALLLGSVALTVSFYNSSMAV